MEQGGGGGEEEEEEEEEEEGKEEEEEEEEEEVFQNWEFPRFAVVSPQLFVGARRPFSLTNT